MVELPVVACRFPTRWWRQAVLVSCAILALTGCSGTTSETTGVNGQATSPDSARSVEDSEAEQSTDSSADGGLDSACQLLTAKEVADLAGEDLGEPQFGSVGGLPGCLWGSFSGVAVQVISIPATTWAEHLPGILDQVQGSPLFKDDPENRRKLAKAQTMLRSGDISSDTGCDMFSLLLEIQGQPAGRFRTVNLVPSKQNPQGINAQICTRGTYTSVLLVRPGLSAAAEPISLVTSAMLRAHERTIS